jgi:hypothetical protein
VSMGDLLVCGSRDVFPLIFFIFYDNRQFEEGGPRKDTGLHLIMSQCLLVKTAVLLDTQRNDEMERSEGRASTSGGVEG